MRRFVISASVVLLLGGCADQRHEDRSEQPSPLYAERPCPGSATSIAGGPATPFDCVPGGREGSGRNSNSR
jgi:hypothetical protein